MLNSCLLVLLTEEESRARQKIERRSLREKANPLEMPDNMFGKYFRVNKFIFKYLLDELSTLPPNKKSFAIPLIVKLSACLRFLAEGGYQKGVGKDDDVCLAQSSMSEVLSEMLSNFENILCPKWILWPNDAEKNIITQKFYDKYKLPGVVGCIDGTHVNIVAPSESRHLFYNRKGAFSINVMVVCDNDMKIRCIDAAHPGASHDSLIWNVSEIRASMERIFMSGSRNMWLLGDAGYPLEPWLMTPYRNPESSYEKKYNENHSKCRNIVERTIGVLKNRWRCLLGARQLHYAPVKAAKIINVCAALHNICVEYKCGTDEIDTTQVIDAIEVNAFTTERYLTVAHRIRMQIANSL